MGQGAKHIQCSRAGYGFRRIKVTCRLIAGAGEIDTRSAGSPVDVDGGADNVSAVHLNAEAPAMQLPNRIANHTLGVVEHVPHVGIDGGLSMFIGEFTKQADATRVGGNLSDQISKVLSRVACRPLRSRKMLTNGAFPQFCVFHQTKVLEQNAFFIDARAVRWHRTGADAADVGVVRA